MIDSGQFIIEISLNLYYPFFAVAVFDIHLALKAKVC